MRVVRQERDNSHFYDLGTHGPDRYGMVVGYTISPNINGRDALQLDYEIRCNTQLPYNEPASLPPEISKMAYNIHREIATRFGERGLKANIRAESASDPRFTAKVLNTLPVGIPVNAAYSGKAISEEAVKEGLAGAQNPQSLTDAR